MDYDKALELIGEFGPYQRIKFILICFVVIASSFHNLGYVFWAARPDHWCAPPPSLHHQSFILNLTQQQWKIIAIPQDDDGFFSECSMYAHNYSSMTLDDLSLLLEGGGSNASYCTPIQSCDMWQYDTSQYISTIVTDYNLVCQRKWLRSTSQSVYMVGRTFGTVVIGHASDRFGRRPTLLICIVMSVLFSVLNAFTPEIYTFMICRFLLAVGETGMFQTSFLIVMELVGQSWRTFTGTILEEFWALGYITLAGVSYMIRDRFTLQLVTSVPFSIFILYYWFIPESPRWLIATGRVDEANKLIMNMADYNGVKLPDDFHVTQSNKKTSMIAFSNLFKSPIMLRTLLILFYLQFTLTSAYTALSLGTSNFSGNDYVNFAVSGAVEIPAYIVATVALPVFGRRGPTAFLSFLAAVALIISGVIPNDLSIISTNMVWLGKFAITAACCMIIIHTAELLPTPLRGKGVGLCNVMSGMGSMIAPYIEELGVRNSAVTLILYGIMSLIGAVMTLPLPETNNKHWPETIEDAEKLARDTQLCPSFLQMKSDREDTQLLLTTSDEK